MKCNICNSETRLVKELVVRKKYKAEYCLCNTCGFMHVNNPTWLKEAYEKPINITDTGYVMRNVFLSKKTLILFALFFGSRGTYLDYAGGYGILTRLMRDYGLNFLLDDPYTQNFFAQGFEYKNQKIEAITCFECFEHLESPIKDIEKMIAISPNIFFSTRLLPKEIPSDNWDYYGTEHGQHISFYSLETLKFIAKKYNLYLYSNNDNLHLFTKKKKSVLLFKIVLILSKLQADILIRKLLKSKTTSDSHSLKNI